MKVGESLTLDATKIYPGVVSQMSGTFSFTDDEYKTWAAMFPTMSAYRNYVIVNSQWQQNSYGIYVVGPTYHYATVSQGTDMANADTDGKMCVWTANPGTDAGIKNRAGSTQNITIQVFGFPA